MFNFTKLKRIYVDVTGLLDCFKSFFKVSLCYVLKSFAGKNHPETGCFITKD